MSKRFRRTPEEIKKGLSVERAKKLRETKELQEYVDEKIEAVKTQKELEAKHAENTPKGLGDVVEAITEVIGIKSLVKFVAGEDCGCDERKAKLNKLRFRRQPLCLLEDEYAYLHDFFSEKRNRVSQGQNVKLTAIHARVLQIKGAEVSSCSSCLRQTVSDLNEIYKTYE
jgi:hypothetical protein